VSLGEPERKIERVNVAFEVIDRLLANVLSGPELKID
jgi:hypothetical protein